MRARPLSRVWYHPDRIRRPLLKQKDDGRLFRLKKPETLLKSKIDEAVRKAENRVHLITEAVGQPCPNLFDEALKNWKSRPPHIFEPFAYEALKMANQRSSAWTA